MEIFVYKKLCHKCNEEKPFAEMVTLRGQPISICRACDLKYKKSRYKNVLRKGERHPWEKIELKKKP